MGKFLKKFFSLKHFSKKQIVFTFLFFLIFSLLIPTFSQAQLWQDIVLFLPSALISAVFRLLLLLASGFLGFANWILGLMIKNPFDISFTNPGGLNPNPIIAVGWTLLRDLTNMFFILGLAYIGLATALNLAGFETKKIFARILLIALIINFTPVICGVIVDVSNILANFFLTGVNFDTVLENFDIQRGEIMNYWSTLLSEREVLLNAVFLIGYGFLGGIVLLLFALLFLVRYPVIWILVILSPLAFFAWIFPDRRTRKIWDKWWEQFIQWSFVIVPAALFLYLSQHILANIDDFSVFSSGDKFINITNIAPYLVALLFLIFGFVISLQTSGMGAQGVIAFGAKIGGKVTAGAKWVGKKGLEGTERWLEKIRGPKPGEEGREEWEKEHKIRAGLGKAGRFAFSGLTPEEKERWGKTKLGKFGKGASLVTRTLASAVTLGAPVWARPLGRYVSGRMEEERERRIQKTYAKVKGKTLATQEATLKNSLSLPGAMGREQRIGTLQAIAEDRNFEKIITEEAERKRIIKKILADGLKFRPETVAKTLRFLNPYVTDEVVKEMKPPETIRKKAGLDFSEKDAKKFENLAEKLIATIKPDKMSLWSEDVAGGIATSKAAHEFWTGAHVGEGGKLFGTAFFTKFQEGMQSVTRTTDVVKQKAWYEEHNKPLFRFLHSSPAQAAGVGFGAAPKKEEISEEELKRRREPYLRAKKKLRMAPERPSPPRRRETPPPARPRETPPGSRPKP